MRLLAIKEMVPAGKNVADVTLTVRSTAGLAEVSEAAVSLKKGKEWVVEFNPVRRKRSLSANAYAWVLIDKLAQKLGLSKTEVYREHVRLYGTFQVVKLKTEAANRFREIWESNGIGYIAELLNEALGEAEILAYPGTSTYNTAEMARFIDGLVTECREQGIETMEPERLKSLVEAWK
ncbi:hypothetical protein [Acidaminococcus massiliensis]|uniref:hypothetical protein n=1 Tax=Acidaminococcus massiliensis TaxID=1852375 RepID=UPI0022E5C353|nr:hypothetical protein [Acidaminococcus massiliensis]